MYLVFQLRTHSNLFDAEQQAGEEEAHEEPSMGPVAAGIVLVVVTLLVAVCADYLVGSIDAIVESAGISRAFIGLILIPIVGNAAEHVTAVVVAVRNKMDLAMGVAIGSSIQIALFMTPFLVIVAWIMDRPMSLHFETCEYLLPASHLRHNLMEIILTPAQSKPLLLLFPFLSLPTLFRTASRTISKAPCSSASTLLSRSRSTPLLATL
jgi:calcium/proton exchanger cax